MRMHAGVSTFIHPPGWGRRPGRQHWSWDQQPPPMLSALRSSWLDAEGGTASRVTAGTNSPGTCGVPSTAPTRWFLSCSCGVSGREGQWQHMLLFWYYCSWHLQTQTNTATTTSSTTSSYLKRCFSGVSFKSHLPYAWSDPFWVYMSSISNQ